MLRIPHSIIMAFVAFVFLGCRDKSSTENEGNVNSVQDFVEDYRPQFHFSPPKMWMNDPNGLVYNEGVYHLFYQYYPEDIVWGPMHWGHAVSEDMIHWEHKPIALYPDDNGYIFSGSAVVDKDNTSGFAAEGQKALVAIFTYHDPVGEEENSKRFQTQGIAYSLDNGKSWSKYEGNPVINNEGIKDFRDPKVFWHDPSQSWIMVLVAGDHAKFYRSPNLKDWNYLSEFGREVGGHGGVWECPDLFQLQVEGSDEKKWVHLISINPNAPNGGSGTQYFIGEFDGTTFTSEQQGARWLDWGRDNYAGVTYNDVPGGERIFIGWMSNWDYARDTPTEEWRSAMTIPRKLSLKRIGDSYELLNYPLNEFNKIVQPEFKKNMVVGSQKTHHFTFDHFNESEIRFRTALRDFKMYFSNDKGDSLLLSMDQANTEFILDRRRSGKVDFHEKFAPQVQQMPIGNLPEDPFEIRILMDWSSIEVFINQGQYVMTSQIFPNDFYKELDISNGNASDLILLDFEVNAVNRIWENSP